MKNSVAIITARGGSKRIPRKNIKSFLGHPIIKYSIDSALNSGCFDEVMVSTDDKEIADVALSCGATVPFFRSPENSNDYASTPAVIEEVLNSYKQNGKNFLYACCIYPTAPFITAQRLQKGFKLLQETNADYVIPVTKFSYPIQRAIKIVNDRMEMFWPKHYTSRSQDLTPAYHDCGQFYWMKSESILQRKPFFSEGTVPLVVPELEVQDIDNPEDWKMAELKYQLIHKKI
jgi:pseudaminic acid cytidylyltransferase